MPTLLCPTLSLTCSSYDMRGACLAAVSIFQSKNEPEIGPGGKGQAAG